MRYIALIIVMLATLTFAHALRPTRLGIGFVRSATAAVRPTSRFMCDSAVPVAPELEDSPLSKMEIRVGQITEISVHPEAEGLFVEKIDCGEEDGPRTIVSGLVKYCKAENLLNKQVVVLCNLKPRALKGIMSAGMVLCASNEDHTVVEPLEVPTGVANGELVTFSGHRTDTYLEPSNKSVKVFGKIADKFGVTADGLAAFDSIVFDTTQGPITSKLLNGSIS